MPTALAEVAAGPTTTSTAATPALSTMSASAATRQPQQGGHPDDANNPLLRSYIPAAPSAAIMEALVSAPPLSYNAARAGAGAAAGKPQRRFCEICGYWGGVRCLKCGARVCGLECLGVHGEGRCLKFYA